MSGTVKVFRTIAGKEVELAILGKGAVLGEMALIDGRPRSASAKALDECTVTIVDADSFLNRVKGVPPWFMTIIKMTCQKIRNADKLLQGGGSQHGANIILALNYQFARWGETIDTALTKKRLSGLLGASDQTISRIGEFLHKSRFIIYTEETIKLFDKKRMSEYCEFLRLLIHRVFERAQEPVEDARSFVLAVAREYPGIITASEHDMGTTEIAGAALRKLVEGVNLGDAFWDVMGQLEGKGVLSIITKEEGEAEYGDDPTASQARAALGEKTPASGPSMALQISNDQLKQWYLFFLYNGMKPCI